MSNKTKEQQAKTARQILQVKYTIAKTAAVMADAEDCTSYETEISLLIRNWIAPHLSNKELAKELNKLTAGNNPDPKLWPEECQLQAQQEGWDIFDAEGSADGRWQLQAIAAPTDHPHLEYTEPKFADDKAAAEYVAAKAKAGSELHQRAIRFLVKVGSRDIEKFQLLRSPLAMP